jgi:hypothetical protein
MILPLLLFVGCGSVTDSDYDGAARVVIIGITDEAGSTALTFWAHEKTTDGGLDGNPATSDAGNMDGDPSNDTLLSPSDLVAPKANKLKILVFNEPRLGVTTPINLIVERVVFTYRDAFGRARAFAPQKVQAVSAGVSGNNMVEVLVTAVPMEMKTGPGGLRDIFLFSNDPDEIFAASHWTVTVDVYARDYLNGDVILGQQTVTMDFVNPMSGDFGTADK